MALYALISPGGSPGVTTSALALALTWPLPVIVAECDPAGGDLLAGVFAGHLPAPPGLLGVALGAARGSASLATEVAGYLAPLDDSGGRMFLAGIADPRQAPGLAPVWPAIGAALAAQAADVLADCGRFDAFAGQPGSVLQRAAAVVVVLRPSLRQVAAARPRLEAVAALLGGTERLGLLLVGDGGHGPADIAAALGVPVLATLPDDPRTATVLSDGAGRRSGLAGRPLLRAARVAGHAIRRAGERPDAVPARVFAPTAAMPTDLGGLAAPGQIAAPAEVAARAGGPW
jgi:hypothetical protein